MPVPFDTIIATLSPERRAELEAEVASRIEAYESLLEFRRELGLTQDAVAERLAITQESVSRLERRKDMHLSTLKRYIEALGGELEIHVKFGNGADAGHKRRMLELR